MDKCTRTTTEDALAHKPQETYKSCTNTQRKEKVQQVHQRAVERVKGMEAHLYVGNPSMSLNSLMQQSAMGEAQMNRTNPSTVETTTTSINDLCTQLESLMLNKREEVINRLHIT